MEEAETDRRRICQEQSRKNCLWSDEHTLPSVSFSLPLSLSLFSPSFSPFTLSFLACVTAALRRCEHKAADLTHYFRRRTCCIRNRRARPGSSVHLFLSSSPVPPWASRWGCRAPLAMESKGPAPSSGQSMCFQIIVFTSAVFCKKLKHDSGALHAYYWLHLVSNPLPDRRLIIDLGNRSESLPEEIWFL